MKKSLSVLLFPIYTVILIIIRLMSSILVVNLFLDINIVYLIWMICLYTFKCLVVNDKLFKLSLIVCYSSMFILLHYDILIA